jgi:uncharacterized protein YbbK (DUF523 family)
LPPQAKTFIETGLTGSVTESTSKILISACLLGQPVRFDGQSKFVENTVLQQWNNAGRLVPVCPEVSGGLPVPRPAAEIQGSADDVLAGMGHVTTKDNGDVSQFFLCGAQHALKLCRQHNIRIAILKENSPSCGSTHVPDGSFSGKIIPGEGVTARLLRQNGIRVYSENQISEAAAYVDSAAETPV